MTIDGVVVLVEDAVVFILTFSSNMAGSLRCMIRIK